MKIRPVFHVSLVEPYSLYPVLGEVMPPPPPVEIEGHREWEVERVLDSGTCHRQSQYLVSRWLEWDAPSWQPLPDLRNSSG